MLKLACTLVSSASVSVQVGVVPVQPPLHPRKLLPACGVAVSVTLVPGASFAEQLPGQAMPPWLPVTEPEPVVYAEPEPVKDDTEHFFGDALHPSHTLLGSIGSRFTGCMFVD